MNEGFDFQKKNSLRKSCNWMSEGRGVFRREFAERHESSHPDFGRNLAKNPVGRNSARSLGQNASHPACESMDRRTNRR